MAGNNGDDPAWILMLLFGVLGLICWGLWHLYQPYFLEGIRYLRIAEFAVPSLFSQQASSCLAWLRVASVGPVDPTQEAFQATLSCFGKGVLALKPVDAMKYYNVTPLSLGVVSELFGSYLRWVAMAVFAGVAYYATFVTKRNKFKVRHNLESFIKTQAPIWPVITPIVTFDPAKHSARILGATVPDKLPLFAEPLSPEEWLSFHRVPVANSVPDRESVRRAFCSQLGPRWTGYADLPPYVQALVVAFALKGVQRREESDEFLGRISVCWSKEKGYQLTPELQSECRRLLKDPEVGGKALEIANKHAFRTTALLGLLKWSRFMGGVLAAAQFLWLRGVDRELWYSLNNQGRRSFHTEGAGAIAHFMAEEQALKALPIPRMDTAIVTLNIYMGGDVPVQVPPREEPAQARR